MCHNGHNSRLVIKIVAALAVALLLVVAPACTSKSSSKTKEKDTKQSVRATSPPEGHFDGGTYCIQTLTQGPPLAQPLHFSNKESKSDGSAKDFEVDLAGDALDRTINERHPATDMDRELSKVPGGVPIVFHDGFAETTLTAHYTRSDQSAWSEGGNGVALGGTPWGLFVDKPTVTPVGAENINGFDTIKYAVDTSHETQLEKSALLIAGRLKDYNITGTAWATKDTNCILQYVIEYEEDSKDGKVEKTHYEGAVTKK